MGHCAIQCRSAMRGGQGNVTVAESGGGDLVISAVTVLLKVDVLHQEQSAQQHRTLRRRSL